MSGLLEAIPFPAAGERTRTRTRVDHKTSEEADLVRRIQAHDELAFREIVDRYQSKIFSIIYGVLRNHNDAEDIAQQVFSKVYFSIRNFDFRSSLASQLSCADPNSTRSAPDNVLVSAAASGAR